MARFLAFDFGAESGRAIVAEISGGRVTLDEVHRFPSHNGRLQGTLQWNLLGLWEEIKTGLRNASKRGPVDGVGVDTWGVDFGLIDGSGRVMGNPIHYRDSRTDDVMEKVFGRVPREEVFAATGIQFMQLNTLFQYWALHQQPPAGFAEAKHLLFMPDLFHYLMSGKVANELTIASTSQMLDPKTKTWAAGMLGKLGLRTDLLGEIVMPGTKLGGILPEVARETGFTAGTPVIAPGTHDTASAVAAVPVTADQDGWCYLSSGTWSLMGVETDTPVIDERTLALNYTNELGVGGKVRLLKNIMGLWLVQETRRDMIRRGAEYDYAQLTQMAAAEPGLKTILDTWHGPFATPGDFMTKIETYARQTGQDVPTSPGAFVRACLDSLALSYRAVVERLEQLTGKPITTIHIVGGGTKNQLLNQLTADATGRKVVTGPIEATALGNVLTQAIGVGAVGSLAEARKIIAESFDVQVYEPRDTAGFEKVYPRFKELTGM